MQSNNSIEVLQSLIRCPSVTPEEGGALQVLEDLLTPLGFNVERMVFSDENTPDVENLYARLGTNEPHIMFAGHTDVVPTGDVASWSHDPFSADIEDGIMYGRGAVDMKGGIACFVAAVARYIEKNGTPNGSISFLITGDEEGPSINGTDKLLKWAAGKGEKWNGCIVGEPTNPNEMGDMIKVGRRGSLSARITVQGVQGHSAYQHLADNPTRGIGQVIDALYAKEFDSGTENFPPTNLEITSVDVGNPAVNVIPEKASCLLNVRFNDVWNEETLKAEIIKRVTDASKNDRLRNGREPFKFDLEWVGRVSHVFLTHDEKLIEIMRRSVIDTVGREPDLSTTGGTSDARFIKDYCPVVEFGLVGQSMHKIDEHVVVSDLEKLTDVYWKFLEKWFS